MAGLMDTLNDALYGRNVYRDGEEEERANREPPVEVEEDDPPPEVPPPMTLVLLCVGTYGDVQPFVLIAKRLQQDGHRVRVASHPEYRPFIVNQNGLEFYPLGGDPRALSALLVKTGGWLMPNAFTDADQEWYSASFEMIGEIMVSSWPACTEPDPGDPQKRPFVADAILANPVAYGHIHCAEALNVPLHLLFLQPWTPTVSFPHPFSNLPYSIKNTAVNRLSYFAVDGFFWTMGMRSHTAAFRETLQLPSMSAILEFGLDLTKSVPMSYLWSPALVPTPEDWGSHIDVVGSVFNLPTIQFKPESPLAAFLAGAPAASSSSGGGGGGDDGEEAGVKDSRAAPIYIGFGSMVIDDEQYLNRLMKAVVVAANATRSRVILQSSWARFDPLIVAQSSQVFVLSTRCPHDWLFARCSAVIHHGGASTTAMGLRCGRPTMICPFFGDQFFWASIVVDAGVGVAPVSALQLDAEVLCERFVALRKPEIVRAAAKMALTLQQEDGVVGAVESFYRQWHVDQTWRKVPEVVAAELKAEEEEDKAEKQRKMEKKQKQEERQNKSQKQSEKRQGKMGAIAKVRNDPQKHGRCESQVVNRAKIRAAASKEARDASRGGVERKHLRDTRIAGRRPVVSSIQRTSSGGGTKKNQEISHDDGEDKGEGRSEDGSVQRRISDMLSLSSLPSLELPDMPASSDMIPDISNLSFFSDGVGGDSVTDAEREREGFAERRDSPRGGKVATAKNRGSTSLKKSRLLAGQGAAEETGEGSAGTDDMQGGPLQWLIAMQEERATSVSFARSEI